MSSPYELNGSVYPRTTEILDAYPDGGKDVALKDWAGMLAIKDLCQKVAEWTPEDAGEHMHGLMSFFDEKDKPKKEQDKELLAAWNPVVMAHKQAHRDVLRFLGDAGTEAHSHIEKALRLSMGEGVELDGVTVTTDQLSQLALNAAANWGRWYEKRAKPYGFKPVALELSLISPTLGFGGTVDCLAEYKGGLWTIDWKSSSRIDRKKHAQQVTAYTALVEDQATWVFRGTPQQKIVSKTEAAEKWPSEPDDPVTVDGMAVVRVDRTETAFEHYEVPMETMGAHWAMFLKCLEVVEAKAKYERDLRALK